MTTSEMTRDAKVGLFCLSMLDDLKKRGLVDGNIPPLTPKGQSLLDQLLAEGFRPTDEEVRSFVGPLARPV